MTNEAVPVEGPYEFHDFTITNASAVEKGTIMQLTDPRTCSALTISSQIVAGIAAVEKVASDGQTELSLCTKGFFDLKASGAITAGDYVVASGSNNLVEKRTLTTFTVGNILGKALETATDAEVIEVAVGYI